MASIKILAGVFLSTGLAAVDDTKVVPLAEAYAQIAANRARWSAVASVQKFSNVDWKSIISTAGDGLASLDSILLAGVPINTTTVEVFFTGDEQPRIFRVVIKGALAAGDIVQPPDYDADANDRVLVQIA